MDLASGDAGVRCPENIKSLEGSLGVIPEGK